jgi:hypothetical protein
VVPPGLETASNEALKQALLDHQGFLLCSEENKYALESDRAQDWSGRWRQATHLSPFHILVTGDPKMTLEQLWQEKKCLAAWDDE